MNPTQVVSVAQTWATSDDPRVVYAAGVVLLVTLITIASIALFIYWTDKSDR